MDIAKAVGITGAWLAVGVDQAMASGLEEHDLIGFGRDRQKEISSKERTITKLALLVDLKGLPGAIGSVRAGDGVAIVRCGPSTGDDRGFHGINVDGRASGTTRTAERGEYQRVWRSDFLGPPLLVRRLGLVRVKWTRLRHRHREGAEDKLPEQQREERLRVVHRVPHKRDQNQQRPSRHSTRERRLFAGGHDGFAGHRVILPESARSGEGVELSTTQAVGTVSVPASP